MHQLAPAWTRLNWHATLWFCFISKHRIVLQGILWDGYLWCAAFAIAMFLASASDAHACETANTASFAFTPTEFNSKPTYAVPWMFIVNREELANCFGISCLQDSKSLIEAGTSNTKMVGKVFAPSWVDLVQDG